MIVSDRGLGSVFGLGGLVPWPSYEDCSPLDAPCVARNQAKSAQYGLDVEKAEADSNYTQCLSNANNAGSPQQYQDTIVRCNGQYVQQTPDIVATLPQALARNTAGFSWTTSRQGGTLYVGDTWQIRISGGAPNSMVTVGVNRDGVQSYPGTQGNLDGNGNWQLSGQISNSDLGVWKESWKVNGMEVGSIAFTALATVATGGTGAGSGSGGAGSGGSGSGGAGGAGNTGNGGSTGAKVLPGVDIASLVDFSSMTTTEMIGLGVGALVVGYMMFGRGR